MPWIIEGSTSRKGQAKYEDVTRMENALTAESLPPITGTLPPITEMLPPTGTWPPILNFAGRTPTLNFIVGLLLAQDALFFESEPPRWSSLEWLQHWPREWRRCTHYRYHNPAAIYEAFRRMEGSDKTAPYVRRIFKVHDKMWEEVAMNGSWGSLVMAKMPEAGLLSCSN
ncbi:hypothetical protein BDZ91DRAFT_766937 [Kalaharituber pfeilii]|nr:hypothetical protein BDZ91DRAFT_766937 [Kalaharituber pfeilii]